MEIREATILDAGHIASLATQLGHKSSPEEITERMDNILSDQSQHIFVAEEDGKVLGFIYVIACWELLSGLQGRIWGLDVDKNTQGKGVGSKLVAEAEKWAKEQGCKSMKVNSNVLREGAHKFYEKNGYVKYKEQAIFKKAL